MAYTTQDISGFYKKYLGRDLEDDSEAAGWLDNANAEQMIKGSGEAQEYAARPPSRTPAPNPWTTYTQAATPRSAAPAAPAPTAAAPASAMPAAGQGTGYSATPAGQLEQQFWSLFPGQSGGNGTITPEQLRAQEANLAKLGITIHSSTGGDNIRLPDGRLIDVIKDVGGQNKAMWHDPTRWQAGGDLAGRSGSGGSSSSRSSSSSTSGGSPMTANPYDTSQRDALYAELLARSKQGLNVNAQTDANIRQQADPFEAAMIRAERERMANVAEGRGPLANLEGERRLGAERVGQSAGAFEAGLVGDEVQARRTEIQNALSQRGSILSQNQQEALQRELAMLDDRLKREQMSQQASQFSAGVGLDR